MEIKTLGELCNIVSGGTPSRSKVEFWNEGTIPWIKIGNIKEKYVNEADEYITQAGLDGSSAKMFTRGTVLYTIFATLGEVGILGIDACTNQAIAGLTIKDTNKLNTDYLYYYLKSKKNYVTKISRGVAQNNINMSMLKSFELPLPEISKQEKIVAILDKVLAIIKECQHELQKLDELIKARFIELFGGYTETVRLSDVATISGGLTKSTKRDKLPLRMPYLRVANVSFASIDVSEMLDIGLTSEEYSKTLLQSGDLLFVEGNGSSDQIGRVAIWENQVVPCVHQNHLIKSRFNKGLVIPSFAMYYFMSPKGREQIKGKAVSTSGLYTLSVSKISDLMLPAPPLDLQNQFAVFVAQTDKSKVA